MSTRILIVEDERIVAADLRRTLRRLGYEVMDVASTGEEAVRVAAEQRPELILMDIRLQGKMDGLEAARRIQACAPTPIIYLTAYTDIFVRDPRQMQPPGLCLSKPFLDQDLQTILDVALAHASRSEDAV